MEIEPARSEAIIESDRGWRLPRLRLRRMCYGVEIHGRLTRARMLKEQYFFVTVSSNDEHFVEQYSSLGDLLEAGWRVEDNELEVH